MTDNKLLKCWLDLVDNRCNAAKYYLKNANTTSQDQNIETIIVDRIKTLAKLDAITSDFGYPDFVELFVNAYVNELLAKTDLQRGKCETGLHPFWISHWKYVRHVEPRVLIVGDFDNNKDYLQLDVFTPLEKQAKIALLTHSFMRDTNIPEIQAPPPLRL